jgi:metal-responsive CopG/Arc/MetJ family transcriptional regulator
MRRLTIIVPDEMEDQLDLLKKEFYYAVSRSEMVRDLVGIGVQEKLRELDAGQKVQAGGGV